MSSKSYSLIIFDLDGTLIDSELDLMHSANYCMRKLGFAERSEAEVRSFIGNGAMKLLQRCLPEGAEVDMDELYGMFMSHYLIHCHEHTFTHPGVREFLDTHSELPKAILTNKPIEPTQQIVEHLEIDGFFDMGVGGDSFDTRKPDPEGINHILEELNIPASQALMVGDGVPDVQVAQAAGVDVVAILNGIGDREQLLALNPTFSIENFEDINSLELKFSK